MREPTKGEIFLDKNARMSVLEQDHFKYDEYYVLETVIMGNPRLYEIMKQKDELYAKPDFSEEDGELAAQLEGEFAELDGWEAETEVLQLLNGLGVDKDYHYMQMKNLKGRDKVKVLLAKALLSPCEIPMGWQSVQKEERVSLIIRRKLQFVAQKHKQRIHQLEIMRAIVIFF